MGVTSLLDQLRQMMTRHLGDKDRYRCVLLQSPDVAVLAAASECVSSLVQDRSYLDRTYPVVSFAAPDMFDDIGAISCHDLIGRIRQQCGTACLLLIGPLNNLDYWSAPVRSGFWTYLAALMSGPGVVVLDTPREEIPPAFRVVDRLTGFDIKILKSRLALTRGHIV